ncbi:vWA domain-containing protein [Nocardia donostiensis]|uniref:VWA containing CoxE family protein n=1 Tax=Nocardia donostiensis TaxID=1538463 RepID=A0A1W0BHZ2_9NOCA|nr:VWA domain-containing protein [Nocardia donostiensis]ONM49885.1 VWA containing CoxE family protein [Nocardia donostiensis]OQS22165.1 VWA containing CoxE family protein [Nocardia donostiensis]
MTTAHEQAGPAQPDIRETQRQILYWRLLAGIFDPEPQPTLDSAGVSILDDLGLPPALLDAGIAVDTVIQRFPELSNEFGRLGMEFGEATPQLPESVGAGTEAGPPDPDSESGGVGSRSETDVPGTGDPTPGPASARDLEVRNAALISKLLLNVFATGSGTVSATQLANWQADAGHLRALLGGSGNRDGDTQAALGKIEGELVARMHLREVLADPVLSARLTPSMSLIEQLLRDKANLSGVALANAKRLIRRYVDEVAEVLRTQVQQSSAGTVDRSVPPKRILRNLDVDRTIWKNLTNWNPEDERLYVDRLFYRQTAKRTVPARMIVVVDQSGSMVDSMVNCTILASIFAGLPKVDVHLIAFDTRALDLTPWIHDPFEVLLRTKLGGGNDGPVAMAMAQPKIADPANTVMVWISDFYEFDRSQPLFEGIQAVHRSGVKFIPVGSVNSSGHQSVNPWFRERFKAMGTPVISGRIQKLVNELKNFLD